MTTKPYTLELEVRDHECDMGGMVNNAHYLHYLEHARFRYLREHGIDFAQFAERGVAIVAKRIEVDYVAPLRVAEFFKVSARFYRISPLRFVFDQEIYRQSDNRLILRARITGTAINRAGRPEIPEELERLLAPSIYHEEAA